MLFARHAEIREDNLLYIEGGGWQGIDVPKLPGTVQGYVAGVVELGAEELSSPPVLKLWLTSGQEAGSEASMMVDTSDVPDDASALSFPFAIPFAFAASEEGTWLARLRAEGRHDDLLTIPLPITVRPASPRPAG